MRGQWTSARAPACDWGLKQMNNETIREFMRKKRKTKSRNLTPREKAMIAELPESISRGRTSKEWRELLSVWYWWSARWRSMKWIWPKEAECMSLREFAGCPGGIAAVREAYAALAGKQRTEFLRAYAEFKARACGRRGPTYPGGTALPTEEGNG